MNELKSYTNKGSLVSYDGLVRLVEDGVITGVDPANINGASIDITLHNEIMSECETGGDVHLYNKENITTELMMIPDGSCAGLAPGDFILASSVEFFNLPDNIAAIYVCKSSMARNGLNHLNAGFCDPTWHGSRLTLELHNVTRHHTLLLKPGQKIGQMIFMECDPVPDGEGYNVKGNYNQQQTVTASKGIQ